MYPVFRRKKICNSGRQVQYTILLCIIVKNKSTGKVQFLTLCTIHKYSPVRHLSFFEKKLTVKIEICLSPRIQNAIEILLLQPFQFAFAKKVSNSISNFVLSVSRCTFGDFDNLVGKELILGDKGPPIKLKDQLAKKVKF